jgi:hypothetical protein
MEVNKLGDWITGTLMLLLLLKIPWYLETDRPYPTSITFTPTPLEVAKSSIVAPIIFSVFVTTNTALLHTLKIK